MKAKHFVVAFDFTEEQEKAFLAYITDDKADALEYIDMATTPRLRDIHYKIVSMQEDKYHLVSMTEDGEFTDFGETDTEKDACNALREEVETRRLFMYDEITMEDEGRGDVVDDDEPIDLYDDINEHIIYGLYADKDNKRIMYFVAGE